MTYETTWIHLGEPWTIEPADAARRIATAGRGGYCFHLNGALSTLLNELGYEVTLHVGGVHRAEPDEADLHNHLVLLVHGLPTPSHPDGTWYVDAGLGDALHGPLPLRSGVFEQGPMTFRLESTPGGVGDWLFTHDTVGSFGGMSFSAAPTDIEVFAARHEFLARSSDSPFARTVTAQLRDADGTTALRGQRVTRTDRTGTTEHVVDDLDTWIELLATTFHIDLSAASPDGDRTHVGSRPSGQRRHRPPRRFRRRPWTDPARSSNMTRFICTTCGTQYGDRSDPPDACAICSDDRQYVGWSGQHWTTLEALQAAHTVRHAVDDGLLGVGITPAFGIPQRSLVLPTSAGNVLWETTSLVTADAVAELEARGGIGTIVISHPHFYASMVEWSEAFGGVPIVLHANDREWIARPSEHIELWDGDVHQLTDGVTLYRCPGHFPGSTVLHRTPARPAARSCSPAMPCTSPRTAGMCHSCTASPITCRRIPTTSPRSAAGSTGSTSTTCTDSRGGSTSSAMPARASTSRSSGTSARWVGPACAPDPARMIAGRRSSRARRSVSFEFIDHAIEDPTPNPHRREGSVRHSRRS